MIATHVAIEGPKDVIDTIMGGGTYLPQGRSFIQFFS